VHFDNESWRGGGYAFLAESAFCMVYSVAISYVHALLLRVLC
jgi:hypothetical protein